MINPVYYDNAATTKPLPEVTCKVKEVMENNWYNASSLYSKAYQSGRIINEAKESIAGLIGALAEEIVFTSGASESDNMVLKSVVTDYLRDNPSRDYDNAGYYSNALIAENVSSISSKGRQKPHIISSVIEHPAVYNTLKELQKCGIEVTFVPVNSNGLVDVNEIEKAIRGNTVLISIMYANNETGLIQPIKEIVEIAHRHNIDIHTDAVQAIGHIPMNVYELGVDYLSASAHKMNGPKGIGFLYIKKGKKLNPLISGGEQQSNRRSGTDNTEGVAGFMAAADYWTRCVENEYKRVEKVRNYIERRLLTELDDVNLNGSATGRLPGILNVSIGGIEAEALIMQLDLKGIYISGGSACASHDNKPSRVLKSMGLSDTACKGSIRISLGLNNSMEEAAEATDIIIDVVKKLRTMKM